MTRRRTGSAKLIQTKVFLPPDLVRELESRCKRMGLQKSEVARLAIAAYLSPDANEQLEAALAARLDRISRSLDRLERDLLVANEAQALHIRAWLAATPAAPDGAARQAMDAKGRERYAGFLEALGRRLAGGRSLAREVLEDAPSGGSQREDGS